MAIVANTFLTFSAIGNREDLEDKIYMVSPTETPFRAMLGRVKVAASYHEWQTDTLAGAQNNAQLEGDDVTSFAAATPTARIGNYTQISSKNVVVSGTQSAVDTAGRKQEMAYQLMKRADELKRDVEVVLTGNRAATAGNSTAARQLRPLAAWYATNADRGAGGAAGSTSAAATDVTQRALTESLLKNVIQACWTAGGNPSAVMVGPFNKTVISGFTGNATRVDKSEDKRLVAAIDVYESDFGALKIVPNRFQRERDCHVVDPDYWAYGELRPMRTEDLAKTGDATKGYIVTEYTLVCRNEAASGVVADLTTA